MFKKENASNVYAKTCNRKCRSAFRVTWNISSTEGTGEKHLRNAKRLLRKFIAEKV